MPYILQKCIEDSHYRYSLTAVTPATTLKKLVLVQCNPSKASRHRSDSTVGKVCCWAEENGFRFVVFLNLFARRSSRVEIIDGMPLPELVGMNNDRELRQNNDPDATIVFAWGGSLPVREDLYLQRLSDIRKIFAGRTIHRVGAMSYGRYPRHGRMWNRGNRSLHELSWDELLPNNYQLTQ
jgi:hypothetical protein